MRIGVINKILFQGLWLFKLRLTITEGFYHVENLRNLREKTAGGK